MVWPYIYGCNSHRGAQGDNSQEGFGIVRKPHKCPDQKSKQPKWSAVVTYTPSSLPHPPVIAAQTSRPASLRNKQAASSHVRVYPRVDTKEPNLKSHCQLNKKHCPELAVMYELAKGKLPSKRLQFNFPDLFPKQGPTAPPPRESFQEPTRLVTSEYLTKWNVPSVPWRYLVEDTQSIPVTIPRETQTILTCGVDDHEQKQDVATEPVLHSCDREDSDKLVVTEQETEMRNVGVQTFLDTGVQTNSIVYLHKATDAISEFSSCSDKVSGESETRSTFVHPASGQDEKQLQKHELCNVLKPKALETKYGQRKAESLRKNKTTPRKHTKNQVSKERYRDKNTLRKRRLSDWITTLTSDPVEVNTIASAWPKSKQKDHQDRDKQCSGCVLEIIDAQVYPTNPQPNSVSSSKAKDQAQTTQDPASLPQTICTVQKEVKKLESKETLTQTTIAGEADERHGVGVPIPLNIKQSAESSMLANSCCPMNTSQSKLEPTVSSEQELFQLNLNSQRMVVAPVNQCKSPESVSGASALNVAVPKEETKKSEAKKEIRRESIQNTDCLSIASSTESLEALERLIESQHAQLVAKGILPPDNELEFEQGSQILSQDSVHLLLQETTSSTAKTNSENVNRNLDDVNLAKTDSENHEKASDRLTVSSGDSSLEDSSLSAMLHNLCLTSSNLEDVDTLPTVSNSENRQDQSEGTQASHTQEESSSEMGTSATAAAVAAVADYRSRLNPDELVYEVEVMKDDSF